MGQKQTNHQSMWNLGSQHGLPVSAVTGIEEKGVGLKKARVLGIPPVDRWLFPLFIEVQPSTVVQEFFHPQYLSLVLSH